MFTLGSGCGASENSDGTLTHGTHGKGKGKGACVPKRVTVLLDSRDRDYTRFPSPNGYVVKLPCNLYNVTSAVLRTAEIPSSFYVFSVARANTSLKVTINGVSHTITIPDGNYTFTTMAAALTTALTASFPTVGVSATFNDATYKLTLKLTDPAQATYAIAVDTTAVNPVITPAMYGLAYYMGFPPGVVTSGVGSVTAKGASSLNPEAYILVDIDELNQTHQSALYGTGGTQGTVFSKIPVFLNSFGLNVYDKHLCQNEYATPIAKVEQLHVALRFHDGTLIDFQGIEHSLTLEVMCTLTR